MENRIVDKSGAILNPDLDNYKVPTSLDFEDIVYGFINEADEAANSLGAKGLGEPALIPTAPAISNAITRATGLRFLSLPVTRGIILQGLQNFNSAGRFIP